MSSSLPGSKPGLAVLVLLFCATVLGSNPAKLLIVSFDAFRYNYVNTASTPNLMRLRERGTYAEHMINVFPTKTFPNHFSLATGMYVDGHGIFGSHVLDNGVNIGYSQQLFTYNKTVLPFWIMNQMAGRYSGVMMWGGGEFSYKNTVATLRKSYDKNAVWQESVDTALQWFQNESTPANVVMMYFDQPDHTAHRTGTGSKQTREQITRVDNIVGYLEKALTDRHLDDVNVFLLADHGMENVPYEHTLDVYVPTKHRILLPVKDKYTTCGSSPVVQIMPEPGSEDRIYKAFLDLSLVEKGFKVYRKAGLPPRWRVTNFARQTEILLVADIGYGFKDLIDEYKFGPGQVLGVHGFDNKHIQMHPFFQAFGPAIKKGHTIEPFKNIDLFSLWCHLIDVEDVQSHGDFGNVKGMLNGTKRPKRDLLTIISMLILLVI